MIEICTDLEYIKSVMFEDEMWARSSDDYMTRDERLLIDKPGAWLKCYHDGVAVGLATVRPDCSTVINMHIHIVKQHRGRNTKAIGQDVLRWVKQNVNSRVRKINTKVPVIYKDVIRFAHSLGFQDEGIDRQSIMKNGQLVDRLNLGILVENINE